MIDENLAVVQIEAVRFDDLGFGTTDGYTAEGETVTAPTAMFLKAYDQLFPKFNRETLSRIHGISASGQQHGSVFWKSGAINKLSNMDAEKSLLENLGDSFSKNNSPIWMDSSTTSFCKELEEALGGQVRKFPLKSLFDTRLVQLRSLKYRAESFRTLL